jgi:hypothetical protein
MLLTQHELVSGQAILNRNIDGLTALYALSVVASADVFRLAFLILKVLIAGRKIFEIKVALH